MFNASHIFAALMQADAPAPTVQEIGQFVQMVFWLVGCVGALLGVAVAIKQLRHRPAAPRDVPQPLYVKLAEEFATKLELERIDLESRGRAAVNRDRIEKLEGLLDGRHKENVASITALGEKIEKAREDVRHDVRQEVQPIQGKIDSHNADVAEKFQELAREIGGLKSAKDTNDALGAEVRQTLNILLSRTAPAARRGGGAME